MLMPYRIRPLSLLDLWAGRGEEEGEAGSHHAVRVWQQGLFH